MIESVMEKEKNVIMEDEKVEGIDKENKIKLMENFEEMEREGRKVIE